MMDAQRGTTSGTSGADERSRFGTGGDTAYARPLPSAPGVCHTRRQTLVCRRTPMLRFIVFACGAALMGLELVAARVLAPYLGNSIYVWGAVISVVMIALSLGYWFGGQIADRFGAARSLSP